MILKVTRIHLNIHEQDFEPYEEELVRCGWRKVGNLPVFRKQYGDTEVEVKEYIPTFSGELYFVVSARNENGISFKTISAILEELRHADKTQD